MMGLAIFLSGSYFAPAISMMQNSVSPQNSGYVVASYGLVSTLAQTIAPIIFSFFGSYFDIKSNPHLFGPLIAAGIGVPYLISSIFYWRAGNNYVSKVTANAVN